MERDPYGPDRYDERPRARVMRSKKGRAREAAKAAPARETGEKERGAGTRRISLNAILAVLALLCLAGALFTGAGDLAKREKADEMVSARLKAEAEYGALVQRHEPRYGDLIRRYAAEYDLEPAFVAAVIYRESHFDPKAVSGKNAKGLMQLMPDSVGWISQKLGLSGGDGTVFDPESNIRMGCYLLRYIIDYLGTDDPILVACGYHAGWGEVPGWIKAHSSDGVSLKISEIPAEDTRTYAERVVNSYAVYLQHYYPSGGADHSAGAAPVHGRPRG